MNTDMDSDSNTETQEIESEITESAPMELEIITSWNDVPEFENLLEERTFWSYHQLDQLLLHHSMVRANSQELTNLTIKMDPRLLSRLKRLAKRRYTDLPSMIRLWLVDRLEREQGETEATYPNGTDI